MEIHAHVPQPGKTYFHWLLEGVFIVASVVLASSVGQCRESHNNHELAGQALRAIQSEVEFNIAALEPLEPIHRQWVRALGAADTSDTTQSGIDLFFSLRPTLPKGSVSNWASLRRSAWDAALSSGALRVVDYDVVAKLTDIYAMQAHVSSAEERLSTAMASPLMFDPAERKAAVRVNWLAIADIDSAEVQVIKLCKEDLPAIQVAAKEEP